MAWPVVDSVKNALHYLFMLHRVLLCVYMMRFAQAAWRLRKFLFALVCVAAALVVLSGWAVIVGAWSGLLALETIQFSNARYALFAAMDVCVLLCVAERVLLQHADSSSVSVLLDDESGHYGTEDENDPALVSLRTDHARVDLHTLETAIDGEWAYPMVARGRLVGALVLGPKRSQEAYAPDESAAITQLANSVGGALDVLAANGDREENALAQFTKAVTALTTTVSDGFERLGVANLERTGT